MQMFGGPDRWHVHVTDPAGVQHATGTYYARGLGLMKSDPVTLGGWASTGRATLEFLGEFAQALLSLKAVMSDMADLIGDGKTSWTAEMSGSTLRVHLRCGKLEASAEAPYTDGARGEDLEVDVGSINRSRCALSDKYPAAKPLVDLWHEWAVQRIFASIQVANQQDLAALKKNGSGSWC